MAGFDCVSPPCFPVIEMAGFRSAPSSEPAIEMAGFLRRRYQRTVSRLIPTLQCPGSSALSGNDEDIDPFCLTFWRISESTTSTGSIDLSGTLCPMMDGISSRLARYAKRNGNFVLV
jgi:hypothetical protein